MHNSFQIITPIIAKLFEAENRRLEANITKVVEANNEAHARLGNGFYYMGTAYSTKAFMRGKKAFLPLHESLEGRMSDHVSDAATLEHDSVQIRQLLFKMLEPCGYTGHLEQDIRDAVPDCIQDALPAEIQALGRVRPHAAMCPITDGQFYNEVMPRIEFYAAARLFY